MLRSDLMDYLWCEGIALTQLARRVRKPVRDVEQDLRHLEKSLKHQDVSLRVTPAYCRKCQFEFPTSKWLKPSRCPECRTTWIQEPLLRLVRSGSST